MHPLGLVFFALLGCAPPDPIDADLVGEPTIEILFPTAGMEIELDDQCRLDTVIVVDIDGLDVVDWTERDEDIEGEGHWHGGPDLTDGYCLSFQTFCDDYTKVPLTAPRNSSVSATLVTNLHEEFGEPDQVEIRLVPPPGVSCE